MGRGAGGGLGLPRNQPNPLACLGKALNEASSKGRGQGGGLLLCRRMEFLSPSPEIPSPKLRGQSSGFKERGTCEPGMEKGKPLVAGIRCVTRCFLHALLIGCLYCQPPHLCFCPSSGNSSSIAVCLFYPDPTRMAQFNLPPQEPSAAMAPAW